MSKKPAKGYMGAAEGERCLSYAAFRDQWSHRKWSLRVLRKRYVYYVLSWRILNGVGEDEL
jgi:hypothetical protein